MPFSLSRVSASAEMMKPLLSTFSMEKVLLPQVTCTGLSPKSFMGTVMRSYS